MRESAYATSGESKIRLKEPPVPDIPPRRRDRDGQETRHSTLRGAWSKVLKHIDFERGNNENSLGKLSVCCQYRTQ